MRAPVIGLGLVLLCRVASAATVTVGPGDDWTKLEAAQPGDVVEVAPGTYHFRVDFHAGGTAAQPIMIRAQDPANRPIWDLSATLVGDAPGSYTAGDKGRGCWQFRAGYYRVDGIVFQGCIDHSSAGIRVVNAPSIEVRNCLFKGNTNGMTGAGDGTVIEFSEFDGNGQALAGDPLAHQIYIYGGTLAVRFSYLHDSPAGQDFHVRARDSVLEYNWMTRPGTYLGDLMSCEYFCGGAGSAPITQTMLLRGNVLVQGTPPNHGQIIALLDDDQMESVDATGKPSLFDLTLDHNTVIGTAGFNNALVHALNNSIATNIHLRGNAVRDVKALTLIEMPATMNYVRDGAGNWATTGTDATAIAGTLFGADPMWSASYVPASGSPLVGAAGSDATPPAFEYYRDETVTLMGRARSTALDIGAFEHGNAAPPFDGHGAPAIPDDGGVSAPDGSAPAPDLAAGSTPSGNSAGCGCALVPTPPPVALLLFLALPLLLRKRR